MNVQAKAEAAGGVVAGADAALAELEAVLEGAERVTLHGDDEHQWTASDVWAHLGRWLDVGAQMVERYLAGERDIHDWDGGAEEFNLGWIEEDRALDVAEARSRAFEAWGRLREQLLGVEAGDWNGFLAWHASSGREHVLEHLRYVVEASGVTPPAEAVERLDRDREAWADFVGLLDARPGVPLHDPESPTWTSLEVFGHFARWTEHEVATFEAERDGRERPVIDEPDDVVNERWAAEDRSTDLDEVRSRALRAFAERARLIRSTPADRWTDNMRASVAAEGYDHIAEHRRYIGG